MYLCIEFQEEYKRLDCLCRDYLSSPDGVSEYIRQMESTPVGSSRYITGWEEDYRRLKYVRRLRNQLVHEVGTLESDLCTEEDLEWVKEFHNRILDGNDPFTLLRKAEEEALRRVKQEKRSSAEIRDKSNSDSRKEAPFWKKIFDKIKKFFS